MISSNALYTDLSAYYDVLCADINYQQQSQAIARIAGLFGNGGKQHVDLACGTAPHIWHLLQQGYQCTGLDLNQPMLDLAAIRCPDAQFMQQDLCHFQLAEPVDLITCLLYSIHYSASLAGLQSCLRHVSQALRPGGVFCFNAVDKDRISNQLSASHSSEYQQSRFTFASSWYYSGQGEQQALNLQISRETEGHTEQWQDSHTMVAVSFTELLALLAPYFEVHVLEHDYQRIQPWDTQSGNALFVCVKR
ncbi:class I SAM-dependent DNA methyltransferase [Rheinheimera sp. UJ51]|uniref:class I SAM-dependent DNA methyltransferase n=1 Tax=Rheinheimera sp. UJ51 TaxID=2892446 RepID=UPI00226E768D|nr:class I SAM-dependent methyltransferase [Rheinheimera sp. UJ51]